MNEELIYIFSKRMNDHECDWGDLTSFIQEEELGFCVCGRPWDNLEYIMNGLAHVDEFYNNPESPIPNGWYDEWVKRGHKIFGNEQSRSFFFYWCDKEKLTDHGSSTPGWLTDNGENLLGVLREMKTRGDFNILQ